MTQDGGARQSRVLNTMLANIADGKWPPDAQIPSEGDLAKAFAVSRSTIGRVTPMLRYLGFLVGPPGGRIWIAGEDALKEAWEAVRSAEHARKLSDPAMHPDG